MGASKISNEFRPEIAGLRAIAVLAVVFCHLKFGWAAGGFVGVDIFFVISGYLISKHVLVEIWRGSFSFVAFYLRRFRRILPALISVIAVTYAVGLAWLPPDLLRGLAKESTHALLSIANIQYWREAKEYFAATSDQLPLLHTWSLSLEEQFYLVWPALLMLAARFRVAGPFIAVSGIMSFIAVLSWSQADMQAAFFLMPFRVFEFCIGAAVVFAERRKSSAPLREALGAFGIVAVVVSIFVAKEGVWPSAMALLPCVGTAAVILAGSDVKAARLISTAPFLWVGAISYSLYLVHWPVAFYVRFIFGPNVMTLSVSLVLLAITFMLAWANYRWVEERFRHAGSEGDGRQKILRYVGLVACLVVGTHFTYLNRGLPWRLTTAQAEIGKLQSYGMAPCVEIARRRCAFGQVGAPTKLELVGDSFAHQYVAALDPVLKKAGYQGENSTLGGCPILIGTLLRGSRLEECGAHRDQMLRMLNSSKASIVFAQAWDIYLDTNTVSDFERTDLPSGEARSLAQLQASLERTFEYLLQSDRKILLIGAQVRIPCDVDRTRLQPAPMWYAPNPKCPPIGTLEAATSGAAINAMLKSVQSRWPDKVTLMRPVDYLCDESCPSMLNDVWLYEDSGHFTVAGARYVGQKAAAIFQDFAR